MLTDPKQPLSPVPTGTYNGVQPRRVESRGDIFIWRQGATVNGDL
jgi:hypothetical protein